MNSVTDPKYTDYLANKILKASYNVKPPLHKGDVITLQNFGDSANTEFKVERVRKKRNRDEWVTTLVEHKEQSDD